jgi:hypothetical protein
MIETEVAEIAEMIWGLLALDEGNGLEIVSDRIAIARRIWEFAKAELLDDQDPRRFG